LDSAENNSRSS